MPVTYTNSMGASQTPAFRKSFKWVDDTAEDDDFVAFVREAVDANASPPPNLRIRDLTVDRTGTPTLVWEVWDEVYIPNPIDPDLPGTEEWQQVGSGSRVIGPSGTIWRQASWLFSSSLAYLGQFPMTGYWECDEYGRAFSINDLVVP